MLIEHNRGFTLIEVIIACIIFFLFLSAISESFALSLRRTFKEKELKKKLFCTVAIMYEYMTEKHIEGISTWEADDKEENIILESENVTDTSKHIYRAKLRVLKSEDCFRKMIAGIKLLERIE